MFSFGQFGQLDFKPILNILINGCASQFDINFMVADRNIANQIHFYQTPEYTGTSTVFKLNYFLFGRYIFLCWILFI